MGSGQPLGLKVVDLFSGCGGMSLGFLEEGFKIQAAFDNWGPAVEVYRRNFDHPAFKMDLSEIDRSIERIVPFAPDVIIGGPPCQDYSTAGRQDEGRGRAALSLAFSEIVTALRPRLVVMENVANSQKSQIWQRSVETLRNAGYGLSIQTLDAAFCGVPQWRKRTFVVGCLGEADGFLDRGLVDGLAEKPMTMRDYFGDSLAIEHYFRVPTNYSRRAVFSIDEPSMTIRGVERPIPPGYKGNPRDSAPVNETRPLTIKERSMVQTFPEGFDFFGGKSDLNQMIGNAVPVNMARHVAKALKTYLEEGK